MLRNLLNSLFDLLLPHRCCGGPRNEIFLWGKGPSDRNPADPLDTPETYALFAYHDRVIQRMIWALKYRDAKAVGATFGSFLYDYLAEELADVSSFGGNDQSFLVIPIPLTSSRKRKRGYNQATTIADGLVYRGGKNLIVNENILRRTRDTDSQTAIRGRQKRLANIRGVFAVVNSQVVRGRQIIIVDDVITTGGTMNEARRILKAAGAKIVIAAAVAHG